MDTQTILTILRLLLPVITQVVNIFHGAGQASQAAKKAVDTTANT